MFKNLIIMREYYIHIHYLASLKANQIGRLASILGQTVIENPVRGRNYGYKPTSLPLYPSYSRTKKILISSLSHSV